MLKLGICDFDTSHVVQFTKRINHIDIEEEHWVEGAKIVVGCPCESRVSPERVPKFTEQMIEYKVPLVDKPEDMIGKIDAVLIEANDGSIHLERARPFIEAGIPCFIDKPLAATYAEAEAIVNLAEQKNVTIGSCSSMRFLPSVVEIVENREKYGAPVAVHAHGVQAKMPNTTGWFFYGIHTVEILHALMGAGHEKIDFSAGHGAEHAVCQWKGGALGLATVLTTGDRPFGFTYFGEKASLQGDGDGKFAYRDLLRRVVAMFDGGPPPAPLDETLGVIKFLEDVGTAGANDNQ